MEEFFLAYRATVAAIAALATVAAGVVALYLAQRQSRARLRAHADVSLSFPSSPPGIIEAEENRQRPRCIAVSISNVGPVSVTLSYFNCFEWRVVGSRGLSIQNAAEPDFRASPITLDPGRSADIILTHDLDAYSKMIADLCRASRFGKCARRFPRLTVRTEIGNRFQAKLGRSRRELARDSIS